MVGIIRSEIICFIYFFFLFFSPEVPERNPWNFFPRRSRRGTLETILLVFFSSSFFVVRRVSMDPWDRHLTWARPQTRKYLGADLRIYVLLEADNCTDWIGCFCTSQVRLVRTQVLLVNSSFFSGSFPVHFPVWHNHVTASINELKKEMTST